MYIFAFAPKIYIHTKENKYQQNYRKYDEEEAVLTKKIMRVIVNGKEKEDGWLPPSAVNVKSRMPDEGQNRPVVTGMDAG